MAHLYATAARGVCLVLLGLSAVACGGSEADTGGAPALLVHYQPDAQPIEIDVYRDLLASLPADARLLVAVSRPHDAETFQGALGHDARVEPVYVADRLTPWARDRYVMFRRGGRALALVKPAARLRPQWKGDAQVPAHLERMGIDVEVVETPVAPIGGDTIVMDGHVLIGDLSFKEAQASSGLARAAILAEYQRLFGRKPIIVPSHHIGLSRLHLDLVVASAGGTTLVVADARGAMARLGGHGWTHPRYGRFEAGRNALLGERLDDIARFLADAGFTIRRVPGLFSEPHGPDRNPTVLSYTNCLLHGKRVFLPRYDVEVLDAEAVRVWKSLGRDVIGTRCGDSILAGGGIRCLTNSVQ